MIASIKPFQYNIELKCWKEDGIREEILKVVINLESDNENDSESNDDDSSDGDETEDYEWPVFREY
jgi:hypothetical protein